MKKYFLFIILFIQTDLCLAQVPQAINYQAVIRNIDGTPITNSNITFKVSIVEEINGDNIVYTETHDLTTSTLGLINIQIGRGAIEVGDFTLIAWESPKFLISEILLEGSSNFIAFGAAQILSVPYALYAEKINDQGGIDLIGDTLLLHYTTSGQADSIFFTPRIERPNINISTPVCIGDSIHFDMSDLDYEASYWLTPSNEILNFQDTIFKLQENTLESGVYKAILSIGGQTFELNQWLSIDPCAVETQDDFLIYKNQTSSYPILENDSDNGNLTISKIDNQPVEANSLITLMNYPALNIRINEQAKAFFIQPSSSIDTMLQFSVEVCDENSFCDISTVTLNIDYDELTDEGNILSREEAAMIINSANVGDTIDFNFQTVLIQGKPLSINMPLTIKNTIFKRACTSLTTLAVASSANADTIIVSSSEAFNQNDWILLVNGPDHLDNSSGQILSIKKIMGDTIITFQSFPNAMEVGAKVIHQFPLIRMQPNANIEVTFDNVVFDGNKDCNDYTFDWRYNNTINVGEGMLLQNCTFKNTPTENIFMCGGTVKESVALNLNGSFVHGSCPTTNTNESFVLDNTANNVCQIPQLINGHNEGWFTYSANVRFFTVEGNTATNGGEACFGAQGLDDFSNIFINNTFENFAKKKFSTTANHPNEDIITNNTFINVPD